MTLKSAVSRSISTRAYLAESGLLLVGGQQRVLERDHQLLGLDPLLARQRVHGLKDFA